MPAHRPSTALLTVVTLLAVLGCVSADTSRCPSASKSRGTFLYTFREKCYQFVFTEKKWNDARTYCYGKGAALASTENWSTWNFIVGVLTRDLGSVFTKNGFWLGLHDKYVEGEWFWDEGPSSADTRMSWSKWQSGEPNDWTGQDCVYMRRSYGWRWVDVGCSSSLRYYSFACEYRMLPPTTTTSTTTTTTTTTTPKPTTTPTTPLPTTTPTTTLSTTTPTTTTPTTTTSTTTNATTILKGTKEDILSPPDNGLEHDNRVGGSGDKLGGTLGGKAAASRKEAEEAEERRSRDTGVGVGLTIALLAIIAVLIIILLVRRRRAKRDLPPAHSLANPCYVDRVGIDAFTTKNDLNVDDNHEYASCHIEPSTGNVYVKMEGNTPKLGNGDPNSRLAFANKQYMQPSRRLPDIDLATTENMANYVRSGKTKPLPPSKYLDECGPYTDDGYMQQRHIYAEVPEVPAQRPNISTPANYFDVPEVIRQSQASMDFSNLNVYEEPHTLMPNDSNDSPSPSTTTNGSDPKLNPLYDIARDSIAVASEYTDPPGASEESSESMNSSVHYDVPRLKKSVADSEASV